jgi:hypothetical protein
MKKLTEPFHPDLGVARLGKRRLPFQGLVSWKRAAPRR